MVPTAGRFSMVSIKRLQDLVASGAGIVERRRKTRRFVLRGIVSEHQTWLFQ
jgi:hypothetical protein